MTSDINCAEAVTTDFSVTNMPDSDQPPERGRAVRRALKTRQRLLESALSVFTQQGVDACSIEDITELADVGKGTFYRHFHDKPAILCALSETALLDLATVIRERVAGAASFPDALNRVQDAESDWFIKRADCFRLLLQVQALLVVRPRILASLQTPFRLLLTDVEAMLRPLAPSQTDDGALRRTALAALATPFGALAFQQAVIGIDPANAGEALRFVTAANPPPLKNGTPMVVGRNVAE